MTPGQVAKLREKLTLPLMLLWTVLVHLYLYWLGVRYLAAGI